MEYKDYYVIMGVSRDASQDEIKKAYRKLARQYHPDVSDAADADKKFKELGEAYAVLKDPEKRAAYDQLGQNWQAGEEFRPPPGWQAGSQSGGHDGRSTSGGFESGGFGSEGYSGSGGPHFSDFFEDLFGGGYGGASQRAGFDGQGQNEHARIQIDLWDSYTGATRALQLQAPELRDDGRMVSRTRTLNVKIPKGIKAGQQIRLKGQGSPSMGTGEAGDLFLEVQFAPDTYYRAEDADVYLTLPVAPWEAALGGKVKVPLPTGAVDLTLPKNSRQGSKMRLKGKGLPGKPAGDLYVVLDVVTPTAKTEAEEQVYRAMQDTFSFDARADMRRA